MMLTVAIVALLATAFCRIETPVGSRPLALVGIV
jgi:hypothetical protein